MPDEREPHVPKEPSAPERPTVIDAFQLCGERREVTLELGGVRYRLRITRRNKLILQK